MKRGYTELLEMKLRGDYGINYEITDSELLNAAVNILVVGTQKGIKISRLDLINFADIKDIELIITRIIGDNDYKDIAELFAEYHITYDILDDLSIVGVEIDLDIEF